MSIPMPGGSPEASLKGPLAVSIVLHTLLFGGLLISTIYSHRGDLWGGSPGGGGAISVKLVGKAAVPPAGGTVGVPLPVPQVTTQNRTVDESKGLYKTEPPPKVKESPQQAAQIPQFEKEKQPKYVSKPSRILEDKTPPPENAVPYGQGGAPSVPYGQAQTQGAAQGQPGAAQAASQFSLGSGGTGGGMSFSGGGGGDFGGRFPWYVDAVRNRVSSNWLQSTVDPNVRFAPRAVVSFDILRNGTVTNVQVLQSSGNASVDTSAMRAILGSSPLNALPGEYSGGKVSVEFWFDFKR